MRRFNTMVAICLIVSMIFSFSIVKTNTVHADNTADSIVNIARGELGSTNYSKYYGGNKGAWCADFVTWCAQTAGVTSIASSSSCYYMYQGMIKNGCKEVATPQKGDIVFFYCTNCSSTSGRWCHVGIMEDSVYSIEGNRWSNGVSKVERGNSYSHNGDLGYRHSNGIKRIYVRPNYKTTSQTPQQADLGTDFYAFITNAYSGLDATLIDNNIVLKKEIGTANQVFKFVKQSDGSYAIYDCKYGLVMDVEDGLAEKKTNVCAYRWQNNSNQKWYIYGNEKYTIKAGCTSCVLNSAWGGATDGTNVDMDENGNKEWQKWYIRKLPKAESTTLSASVNKDNVKFDWKESQNTSGYSLKIFKDGINVYTKDNIRELSASVELAKGTYTAYIDSYNEYSYSQSNTVNFTIENTPVDIGTDFYAFITNAYSGLDATLIDDNIVLKKEMGTANQIFKFVKQSDGSYAIYDCKYGLAMDVENGLAEKKTNVCACRWQNNSNQKWYIYGNEKYTIKACCTLCVLNPAWGGVIDGTNIDMDEDGEKEWQKWYIRKLPNIESPQLCVEVNKNNVTFSWQEAKNATGYSLKILRGNESVYTRDNINDLKHNIQLKKGTYTAYIDAYNEYSYIKSNVVEFVVEDEETIEESSTEIVTTTPYIVETTEDNTTQQFTTEMTSDVLQTTTNETTTNETTNQVTIPESTVTENITETETKMESEQQTTQETNQTSTEGLVTDESESARDNLTTQQTSQKISDKVTEHNKKRKNLVTVKIKKATKKGLKSKKINLSFKRIAGVRKYVVEVSTNKSFRKVITRKKVKKVSLTIKSKKLKNKKNLFVRIRPVDGKRWSVKKVKIVKVK